jgi:hypothetical protein
MGKDSRSNLSTWVGSIAAVVSAVVALFTAYKIRFDPAQNLAWAIACLIEAILIIALAVFILRRQPITLPRRIRAQNRGLLESLFKSIFNDFQAQMSELSKSQLSLYGKQVRNAQVHLLDALLVESDSPIVRATDIVRRLDLWPTRGVYLAANKRFVGKGGRISRIFLIHDNLICNDADAGAFWDIMKLHKDMGVNVSLHMINLLSPEYAEDYVLYSRDCVLVEIEQGDVDFARGKVTIFFDARTIDTYLKRFQYLEASNDTKSATEVYGLYRKYFVDVNAGALPFPDRKAQFLREAR